MKIIDILIKTINGEETPDKFIYERTVFTKENNGGYTDEDGDNLTSWIFTDYSNLNDEVKIINENKKVEKLNIYQEKNCKNNWKWKCNGYNISTPQKIIGEKLNEIIDKLEELK